MKITLKVNKADVNKRLDELVEQATKQVEVKGFRKGKAPAKLAREKIDQSKLQERAVQEKLSDAYIAVIREKKLKPVSYPKIDLKTVEKNGDFVFEAEVIEKPKIDLGDYRGALKGSLVKTKIWTPDKAKEEVLNKDEKGEKDKHEGHDHAKEDRKLTIIFDVLLKTCKLDVPKELIDREVNRMLSKLLDQVTKLGLKIEDYLSSIGKTNEQLKAEYEKTASDSLKLEFILQEVAMDQKIDVIDKEVDDLIKSIPDEKTREGLSSFDQKMNLKLVILKRKTLDRLEQLAA